jgi:hypothetical protein
VIRRMRADTVAQSLSFRMKRNLSMGLKRNNRSSGPGCQSERSRTFRAVTELKRAKGPADSSHARQGVVQVADKDEG